MATKTQISDLESKAAELGYVIKVKVNAAATTTVTVTSPKNGHVFEGLATPRQSDPYYKALFAAVTRMVAFEGRLDG